MGQGDTATVLLGEVYPLSKRFVVYVLGFYLPLLVHGLRLLDAIHDLSPLTYYLMYFLTSFVINFIGFQWVWDAIGFLNRANSTCTLEKDGPYSGCGTINE